MAGIPWAPQGRTDNTIAQMMLQAGNARAEGLRRGGEIWANTLGSLGNIAQGYFQQKQEEPFRQAKLDELRAQNAQRDSESRYKQFQIEDSKRKTNEASIVNNAVAAALNPDGSVNQEAAVSALGGRKDLFPTVQATLNEFIKQNSEISKNQEEENIHGANWAGMLAQQLNLSKDDPNYVPMVGKAFQVAKPSVKNWVMSNFGDQIQAATDAASLSAVLDKISKSTPAALESQRKIQEEIAARAPRAAPSIEEQINEADKAGNQPEVQRLLRVRERNAAAGRDPNGGSTVSYEPRLIVANGREIQANYNPKTGKYHDPETGQVLSGISPPPTADMRNKGEGRKLVAKSIDAISSLSDKIITRVGPGQRAEALKRGVEAVFGTDPDFRTYQDARYALAGNLAVAQQGSRPSDADIKLIWLPLVPDAYRDTTESAKQKWQLVREMSNVSKDSQSGSTPSKEGESVADRLRKKYGIGQPK